jgi:phosphoglycolate phosphatase-like HAD superfamily hydrolase
MANKLLLFDIDGTLLSARGIPRRVFLQVIRQRFPDYTNGESLKFSGLTDPLIAQKILQMNHSDHSENERVVEQLINDFLDRLDTEMQHGEKPLIYPGVNALLQSCHKATNCYLGLVTGNMALGAEIKLRAAGLQKYFPVGAFGSDRSDRNLLPPIALKRAAAYYDITFSPDNVWIIGDSVHDVRCAVSNGLHSLAVATGLTPADELAAEHPDILVEDLSDTEKILTLLGIR